MRANELWSRQGIRGILGALTSGALLVSGLVLGVASTASAATGDHLALTGTAMSTTAQSGVAFASQPTVTIEDVNNNPYATAGVVVTASITSPGTGTLMGTGSATTDSSGNAVFSGLGLNALAGTYTLTFSASGYTLVQSPSIALSVGPAVKMAITTQPSPGEVSGVALAQQPVVKIEDSGGNVVTSLSTGTVAATASAGCTITAGGTSNTISSGVATFTGLTMTGASATSCTLTFSYSTFPTVTSSSILMSTQATKLVIITAPSTTAYSGVALAQQPVIWIEDASGTQVKSSAASVSAALTTPQTGTVSGTPVSAVAGAATFTTLAINALAGSGYTLTFTSPGLTSVISAAITVSTGGAAKLAIKTPPSSTAISGVPLTTQPTIAIEDSGGNLITSNTSVVTATFTSGGVSITNNLATASSGLATFSGLTLNALAGPYTITFTDGSLTAVVSGTIQVSPGTASKLMITTQPSSSVASGSPLAVQPVVKITDSGGNVITSNYTTVTASITSSSYTLSHATANAVAGVATFSGLALIAPIGTYTLTFTDGTLSPAVSSPIAVTSGGATHLVISTQPSPSVASGVALAQVPVVKVVDASGNVVTSDASVVLAHITSGGVSVTNGTQTAVGGVATFTGLALNARVGTYTLTFTDGTLTAAVSTSITVFVGPASKLVISTEPSTVTKSGVALTTQPVITVQDSGGNVVTTANSGYVTAGIAFGTGGAVSAGAVAPLVLGVAKFSGLAITGTSGGVYGLVFSGAGLSVTDTVRISIGTPQSPLVITTTKGLVGRPLTLATSGGSGTGVVTFALSSGSTAQGCAIAGARLSATSVGTCVVVATKAASGIYSAISSSPKAIIFVVASKPRMLKLGFSLTGTVLGGGAQHGLIVLAAKLQSGAVVRIVSFSYHNRGIAMARGQAVGAFLLSRVRVTIHYVYVTRLRPHMVKVQTLKL